MNRRTISSKVVLEGYVSAFLILLFCAGVVMTHSINIVLSHDIRFSVDRLKGGYL
jgi:hypothetical protein